MSLYLTSLDQDTHAVLARMAEGINAQRMRARAAAPEAASAWPPETAERLVRDLNWALMRAREDMTDGRRDTARQIILNFAEEVPAKEKVGHLRNLALSQWHRRNDVVGADCLFSAAVKEAVSGQRISASAVDVWLDYCDFLENGLQDHDTGDDKFNKAPMLLELSKPLDPVVAWRYTNMLSQWHWAAESNAQSANSAKK